MDKGKKIVTPKKKLTDAVVTPKKKRTVFQETGPQESLYTYKDVSRILQVKRVALQEWMALGYFTPHIKAKGQGTKNLYSKENLFEIRLFRHLVETGLLREKAAMRVKELRKALSQSDVERSTRPLMLRFEVRENGIKGMLLQSGNMENSGNLIENDPEIYRVEDINIGRIIDEVEHLIKIRG